MAKQKRPDVSEFDRRHNETIDAYLRRIDRIYARARREASALAAGIGRPKAGKVFNFSDHKAIEAAVEKIFKTMHDSIVATITAGTTEQWLLSNIKSDQLAKALLDDEVLLKDISKKYLSHNEAALKAFQQRVTGGMNLSERVWKLSDGYRNELELALDNGIGKGKSASALARDAKQFLKEPERVYRRVRNEHGELKLSRAAKAYSPGQGVYRSSYKNALRLTRSETNMAYQTADHTRNKQMDFVVGIEVVRSNNPYSCPVCGPLAGKYPKTFVFRSWHPNCRCSTRTILMSNEELQRLNMALLNQETIKIDSVNEVKEPHAGFTDWLKGNKERLLRSKSQPYFLKDNNITLG